MLKVLSEPGVTAADNVHQACHHQKKCPENQNYWLGFVHFKDNTVLRGNHERSCKQMTAGEESSICK